MTIRIRFVTPVKLRHIDGRDIDTVRRRVVNSEKARRTFPPDVQLTLETGLSRTAEWFVRSGLAEVDSRVIPATSPAKS